MTTFPPTFSAPAQNEFQRNNPELLLLEAVMTTESGKVISTSSGGSIFCDNTPTGYGVHQDEDGIWSVSHNVKGRNYAQGTTKFAAIRLFVEGVNYR